MKDVKPAQLTLKNGTKVFVVAVTDTLGEVDIKTYDEDGKEIDCGIIMTFTNKGFHRIGRINPHIGFPINTSTQLKRDKEYA